MSQSNTSMAVASDPTPFVEFDCEYKPSIAGGELGKFASENYRLRVDYFGTHQLGHNGCTNHRLYQTLIFHSPADPHKFRARVDLHNSSSNSEPSGCGMHLPFYEAGAYKDIVPVAQVPEILERYPPTFKIAASASVILVFYATTFTTLKQRCWCNVGSAVVPVDMLIEMENKPNASVVLDVIHNRSNDEDDDTSNLRSNPPKKGRVVITRAVVNNIVLRAPTEFDTYATGSNRRAITTQIERLIKRGMSPFFKDKQSGARETQFLGTATKAFLQPYHVPRFSSARYELPSCTYPLLRSKQPLDVACYENFLDIALARSGTTRAEALQWSEFLNAREFTATAPITAHAFVVVAVRMITVFPLSQRYMDDVVNRNVQGRPWRDELVESVEDFKICRLCGGDDCEGVCLEAMMISEATTDERSRMSPLLRRVADLLRLFVPLMTLGCVTNRKATAAPLDDSNAQAHTFCTLMPFWQFYELCHESQRKILLMSRFYRSRKSALDLYRDVPNYFSAVIGEATAPIHPAMRPVESYYTNSTDRQLLPAAFRAAQDCRTLEDAVIAVLDRFDLAEVLQPEMFGPPDSRAGSGAKHDYSQFYKFFMACATPAFADLRRLDFAFALNVNNNDERSYGVPFNQIIDYDVRDQAARQQPRPGLMAYLELSEHDAKLCDAIMLDIAPVPPLQLPSPPSIATLNTERINRWNMLLARLVKHPSANRKPDTPLHRRIQYLTIAEPDVNAAVIESLRQIAVLPQVVSFQFMWYVLNAAVDGTGENNVILDVYLGY